MKKISFLCSLISFCLIVSMESCTKEEVARPFWIDNTGYNSFGDTPYLNNHINPEDTPYIMQGPVTYDVADTPYLSRSGNGFRK